MDLPQAAEEQIVETYTIPHFIYGFVALLGIIIIFSLLRTIYHFYKLRTEVNPQATQSNIEIHSSSNTAPASNRQEVDNNSSSDSDMLRIQLEKLRRLLNRLNAMGTFSRDTIGDLSAQSMPYVNNSTVASSDLSNFWSSIDFDDFEESTVNERNFQKTPTDKSVSLSVSDISQDTDEMHFSNYRLSKNAISIASAFTHQTSASDAIAQILAILNSMPLKSRHDIERVNNDLKRIERNSNESMNAQSFQSSTRSSNSLETSASNNSTMSSSLESIHNKLSSPCGSNNSDTLICTPEIKESKDSTAEMKLTDVFRSKTKLLEQMSQVKHPKCISSPLDSAKSKISKQMRVEKQLIRSSESKNRFARNLSTSKSLDLDKFTNSLSVCSSANPETLSLSQTSKHAESSTALKRAISNELRLKQNENSRKMSERRVTKIPFCTSDKVAENRSLSYTNLSDRSICLSFIKPHLVKSYSYAKQSESNLALENSSHITVTVSELPEISKSYESQNDEPVNGEIENSKNKVLSITSKIICSVSSKSLNLPLSADTETLKSYISERELRQTQYSGMLSPNLSTSSSDMFLSPATETVSPIKNRDFKSPVEPKSTISLPNNFTPCIENAVFSRNSCIWFTPPSATESSIDDSKNEY